MWKLFAIIILVVLSAVITFTTSSGLIDKPDRNRIFNRRKSRLFTLRGWLLSFAFLGTIIISVLQELEDQRMQKQIHLENIKSENTRRTKDSIRKHQSDSTASSEIQKSKNETIEALAKYNLKIDSSTGQIRKFLRDSIKYNKTIEHPELQFCLNGINIIDTVQGRVTVDLKLCSRKYMSTKIEVIAYAVLRLPNGDFTYAGSLNPFPKYLTMSSEIKYNLPLTIGQNFLDKSTHLCILLKGTYSNKEGIKRFPINETNILDLKTKQVGEPTVLFEQKIIEALKKVGKL